MAHFDRYVLSQLFWFFGFSALVLVTIFWINKAVGLFDQLIGDGQTALVFLEFSALGLPALIRTVVPIATFCASVYVTNRLNSESEMLVMMSAGSSPMRLARPVFVFGLATTLMLSVLTHVLVPASSAQLDEREAEVSQNITARLLVDGQFMTPSTGVTFYARDIGDDGILRDVFLSDRRDAAEEVTFTAREAYLVQSNEQISLIMVDGQAQYLSMPARTLSSATFRDVSFDISGLITGQNTERTRVRNFMSTAFLGDWSDIAKATGASDGKIAEELHSRFVQPIFCMIAALIGFAMLHVGRYSRFGVWREVIIAFLLLMLLDGMRSVVIEPVLKDAGKWPIMYLPVATGAVVVVFLLWWAAHPDWYRFRRRAPS